MSKQPSGYAMCASPGCLRNAGVDSQFCERHQPTEAAVKVDSIEDQQKAKFGAVFHCKDCLHAYRVVLNGTLQLQCYEGPPGMQMVPAPGGQALRQMWVMVADKQFCDRFKRDPSSEVPKITGN